MNETHATKYLEGLPTASVNGTAERTRRLLAEMGELPTNLFFIKILGEAGKSSASFLLASILSGAGLRTGTLSLTPRREPRLSMAIDGKAPAHADFAKAVTAAWNAARTIGLDAPTYEEILLATALYLFGKAGCRPVILTLPADCRLSATSALPTPKLCLLTTTTEETARTLIPLIDTADDLVSAPQEPSVYRLLTERAAATRCRLSVPTKKDIGNTTLLNGTLVFSYRDTDFSLSTLALYQKTNALAVIEAYHALKRQGIRLGEHELKKAFAAFSVPLSFRFFSLSPAWVIDSADTPLRLAALAETVDQLPDIFGAPLTVWCEPMLDSDVRSAFGERLQHIECMESTALRRTLKKVPPPKDSPLLIVGSKPFTAEALRALESFFLYS